VHGNPHDRIPDASQLSRLHAHRNWHPQAQSSTVVIRLDFVALLSKIEVGFGRHKERGDVIELVLLLFDLLDEGKNSKEVVKREERERVNSTPNETKRETSSPADLRCS